MAGRRDDPSCRFEAQFSGAQRLRFGRSPAFVVGGKKPLEAADLFRLRFTAAGARLEAEKIVFMTGGTFTPQSRTALEKLPNAKIDKPFETKTLVADVIG